KPQVAPLPRPQRRGVRHRQRAKNRHSRSLPFPVRENQRTIGAATNGLVYHIANTPAHGCAGCAGVSGTRPFDTVLAAWGASHIGMREDATTMASMTTPRFTGDEHAGFVPGSERAFWYFLRISGVILIFFALGHLFITHYINIPSETTFDFVS